MKDKKYKYLEDVIEEYIRLTEEQLEIPLQIAKSQEKYETFLKDRQNEVLNLDDARHVFKIHTQLKKYEENKKDLEDELAEVEGLFKEFMGSLNGSKIAYERKDDNKSKMTYQFWLEGEELKSNRL